MEKVKVFVYMKSGNIIEFECDSCEATRLTNNDDNRSLALNNPNCKGWTIDLREVEAIITR